MGDKLLARTRLTTSRRRPRSTMPTDTYGLSLNEKTSAPLLTCRAGSASKNESAPARLWNGSLCGDCGTEFELICEHKLITVEQCKTQLCQCTVAGIGDEVWGVVEFVSCRAAIE
jgi:hypothetical protein